MTKRSIIVLAIFVVVLYFSIILFMLSPFHSGKNVYYENGLMNPFTLRHAPSIYWCKGLHLQSPAHDVVALVSYPGSGNTWLRYLLQQATGIQTGSIYMDYGLKSHGFPGELITNGSVLVVKTHEGPPLDTTKFKSAVLLVRNPRDAILADFNRIHNGHIGTAPKSAFKTTRKIVGEKKTQDSDWPGYVSTQLNMWESLHRHWLTNFIGRIHIVFYEVLVRDTKLTIEGILHFINHTFSEEDIKCAMLYREGIYRRRKKHEDFDPFTLEMYRALDLSRGKVLALIKDYWRRNNISDIGKG